MKKTNLVDRWLGKLPGSARFGHGVSWTFVVAVIVFSGRTISLALTA